LVSKETISAIGGLIGSFILVWILASSFGMLPTSNRYKETFDTLEEGFYKAGKYGSAVVTGYGFFYYDTHKRYFCDQSKVSVNLPTKEPSTSLWFVQKHSQDYSYPLIIFVKSSKLAKHLESIRDVVGEQAGSLIDKDVQTLRQCDGEYCMCYVEMYPPYSGYVPEGFEYVRFQKVNSVVDDSNEIVSMQGEEVNINDYLYSPSLTDTFWDAFTILHEEKLFNQNTFNKTMPYIKKCIDFHRMCSCEPNVCRGLDQEKCEDYKTFGYDCQWDADEGSCVQKISPACIPTATFKVDSKDMIMPIATVSPLNAKLWNIPDKPQDQQVYIDRMGCVLNIRDMSSLKEPLLGEKFSVAYQVDIPLANIIDNNKIVTKVCSDDFKVEGDQVSVRIKKSSYTSALKFDVEELSKFVFGPDAVKSGDIRYNVTNADILWGDLGSQGLAKDIRLKQESGLVEEIDAIFYRSEEIHEVEDVSTFIRYLSVTYNLTGKRTKIIGRIYPYIIENKGDTIIEGFYSKKTFNHNYNDKELSEWGITYFNISGYGLGEFAKWDELRPAAYVKNQNSYTCSSGYPYDDYAKYFYCLEKDSEIKCGGGYKSWP